MLDLDRQGHLTRIKESTVDRVRFDIQIHAREPRRGVLEIVYQRSAPDKVNLRYGWAPAEPIQEEAELGQIDAAFIADRVLLLLKDVV